MFNTIVVASDGSAHGDRAVELAGSLAKSQGSQVIVVHVTEVVGGKGGLYPLDVDEDGLRSKISGQVAKLEADGIVAEFSAHLVRLGGPAHVIAADAERAGADLIVVGSRGHSPLTQVMLGSVPVRLLQIAKCPVLVVPDAAS